MSSYRIGMNLRVTEDSNQGGRRYMEDRHAIRFVKNDEGGFEFAYFGIFDGHGGGEASKYARDYLLDEITKYDCFWSDNDEDILYAIKSAFLDTHYGMWRELEKWPRTASGLPSTAGTTASICIIKNSKLYIGHVGDSGIVLGYNDSKSEKIVRPKAKMLTQDHKPDDPKEKERIENSGGQVVAKSGVQRVVWNRPRTNHQGPIRRSTPIDKIPFLAVARSLGDLWSYNYLKEEFVVSPEPDVSVHKLDPTTDKCLVIGSDGLWNMLSAEEAITMVVDMEYQFEYKVINDPTVPVSYWINPAERLVQTALNKWKMRLMKADNTSAIVVLIDPLGPRKLSILKKKREERMKQVAENKVINNKVAAELLVAKETLQKSPKKGVKLIKSPIAPKSDSSESHQGQLLGNDSQQTVVSSSGKTLDRTSIPSPVHRGSDHLDESIQLRNAHLVSPVCHGKKVEEKLAKPAVSPGKVKTAPLQTSSSENVCRTGVATRSSPQKSPVSSNSQTTSNHFTTSNGNKAKKDLDNVNKAFLEQKSGSVVTMSSGNAQGVQKCLQPCNQVSDNVKGTCKKVTSVKVKDLENIFSSDVKLGLRNLNIGKQQKLKAGKNLNNSNTSSNDGVRGTKKPHSTKSLSTRISLRLRRIRQKTQRLKAQTRTENKGFVAKAGVKRKMDCYAGSPALKKVKHS